MKYGDNISIICTNDIRKLNFNFKIGKEYLVKYLSNSYFEYESDTYTFKGKYLNFIIKEKEIDYEIY